MQLEPFWADVFARGCAGRDVKTMLLSVGGGAGQQGGAARPDADGAAHLEGQAGKSERAPSPAAPAEESDDDMGFGLFD